MCTLTLMRGAQRLLITMNRDEARFRGPEAPPRLYSVGGGVPDWIGPVDTDSGGTWIGVNDRGVAACLLNRYAPGDMAAERLLPGSHSRGDIIPDVLSQPNVEQSLAHMRERLDPQKYGSFTLVIASMDAWHAFEWAYGDGIAEFSLEPPNALLTSSAMDTAEVLPWRRERYEAWLANGAPFQGHLPAIHLDHPEGKADWATLMDRPISATRSITQVEITPAATTMRYWPREEGQLDFGEPAVEMALG